MLGMKQEVTITIRKVNRKDGNMETRNTANTEGWLLLWKAILYKGHARIDFCGKILMRKSSAIF